MQQVCLVIYKLFDNDSVRQQQINATLTSYGFIKITKNCWVKDNIPVREGTLSLFDARDTVIITPRIDFNQCACKNVNL